MKDETKSFERCNETVNLKLYMQKGYERKTGCHIIQNRIQNETIKENLGLLICAPYYSYVNIKMSSACLSLCISLNPTKKEVDNLNLCSPTQISAHTHTHNHYIANV